MPIEPDSLQCSSSVMFVVVLCVTIALWLTWVGAWFCVKHVAAVVKFFTAHAFTVVGGG